MHQLIGREREVSSALDVILAAKSTPVARTLRIEGPSGIGKSTLLNALPAKLGSEWVVAATSGHRIQAAVPFAVLRRLIAQLAKALGESATRYGAALEETGQPVAAVLSAMLDGVTLDHPVLVIVDDAQWSDVDSLDALQALVPVLAERPFCLLFAVRTDDEAQPVSIDMDRTVVLDRLDDRDAAHVVQSIYPGAPPEVVDMLVQHADGQPIDLVSLAEAAVEKGAASKADVEASMSAAIAARVKRSPAPLREFLQIASLLSEPIEYNLLRRLWPNESVLVQLIDQASERYIVQDGTHLRFRHALVADAILETIPVKIPMRRRIIDALQSSSELPIEDRLQVVEQAIACGDNALAQETLFKVAREATAQGLPRLTVSSITRALELGEPSEADYVDVYASYATSLQYLDQIDRAEAVLQHALGRALAQKLPGVGILAAQYLLAEVFADRHDMARAAFDRYSKELVAPHDRAFLYGAALWFAVCDNDPGEIERLSAELAALNIELPAEVKMRIEIARVYVRSRHGEYVAAREALERVYNSARSVLSANRDLPDFVASFLEISHFGTGETKLTVDALRIGDVETISYIDYFEGLTALHEERLDEAALAVEDRLRRYSDSLHRRWFLSIGAAISSLRTTDKRYAQNILAEIARFLGGETNYWYLPVAAWAAACPFVEDADAKTLLQSVLRHMKSPIDPLVFVSPIALVIAAHRRKEMAALKTIASGTAFYDDRRPFFAAQVDLAAAMAETLLSKAPATQLESAAMRCRTLGLPLYATLAEALGGSGAETARNRLRELGVEWFASKPNAASAAGAKGSLTARERQIAELVAEGKTNREIAESLVLSERTIEGHVANIFNKLGVSSRTQIAAWILRTTTVR